MISPKSTSQTNTTCNDTYESKITSVEHQLNTLYLDSGFDSDFTMDEINELLQLDDITTPCKSHNILY